MIESLPNYTPHIVNPTNYVFFSESSFLQIKVSQEFQDETQPAQAWLVSTVAFRHAFRCL